MKKNFGQEAFSAHICESVFTQHWQFDLDVIDAGVRFVSVL